MWGISIMRGEFLRTPKAVQRNYLGNYLGGDR
jgi:hypothetical protein